MRHTSREHWQAAAGVRLQERASSHRSAEGPRQGVDLEWSALARAPIPTLHARPLQPLSASPAPALQQMKGELAAQDRVLEDKEGKMDHVGKRITKVSNTPYLKRCG